MKNDTQTELTLDRALIEGLSTHDRFALEIEQALAPASADSPRVVKGVANTFGVMRSGRIIHPAAVERWLERKGEAATLPLLANHGSAMGFAVIGKVTKLKANRARGLQFEAQLAKGVELAEQAWLLAQQGMLGGVSLGWASKQARWVSDSDADLDPWLAKKMKEAGVRGALAFMDVDLAEISLVDVPDDAHALLAASGSGELAALQAQVAKLCELCEELREQQQRSVDEFQQKLKEALGQAAQPLEPRSDAGLEDKVQAACNAWAQAAWPELQSHITELVLDTQLSVQGAMAADLEALSADAAREGCGEHAGTQHDCVRPSAEKTQALLERLRRA